MILLAIGDVSGGGGMEILSRHLRSLKKMYSADITVVNGENASVIGASPDQIKEIFDMGADVVTLGNHVWGRRELAERFEDFPYLLRPLNMSAELPGDGWTVVHTRSGKRVAVINLIGRVNMNCLTDNPFVAVDRKIRELSGIADIFVVEIHAEATSEKVALAYYLDGRVSAVYGTHTHIQTADERVLPKGTGYITDLGMTGPIESALGIKPEQAVSYFLGGLYQRYESAKGPCRINGAMFEIDDDTGKCRSVSRISVT